jgi:hypothetical protein
MNVNESRAFVMVVAAMLTLIASATLGTRASYAKMKDPGSAAYCHCYCTSANALTELVIRNDAQVSCASYSHYRCTNTNPTFGSTETGELGACESQDKPSGKPWATGTHGPIPPHGGTIDPGPRGQPPVTPRRPPTTVTPR